MVEPATSGEPSTSQAAIYARTLVDLLDSWWCGVALVNEAGVVLHSNVAAKHFFDSSAIRVDAEGRLAMVSPHDSARLRMSLAAAIREDPNASGPTWSGLSVTHDNTRLIVLFVCQQGPVAAGVRPVDGDSPRCALALFFDPSDADISEELVAQVFGLTVHQRRVARLVARGLGPGQVARTLKRDYETARSHIRELREKTGARRHAELVRLLILTGVLAGRATARH